VLHRSECVLHRSECVLHRSECVLHRSECVLHRSECVLPAQNLQQLSDAVVMFCLVDKSAGPIKHTH